MSTDGLLRGFAPRLLFSLPFFHVQSFLTIRLSTFLTLLACSAVSHVEDPIESCMTPPGRGGDRPASTIITNWPWCIHDGTGHVKVSNLFGRAGLLLEEPQEVLGSRAFHCSSGLHLPYLGTTL